MSTIHVREERWVILRIVATYAILGGLWIYFSDSAVGFLVHDPRSMTTIATYKGLLFIALTSLLLYFLISRYITSISEKSRLLKTSEDRFQSIFHGISDAILIHNAETYAILNVNRTASELFGYSLQEILVMDVGGLSQGTPPYSLSEALRWLGAAAQGTPQKFEWNCRRKDGKTFWAEVSMRAETIGDERCIIVSVRDISDRKQCAEEFNAVIQTTKDGFYICGMDGRLLEVNQSYCDMVGYSREEILRMSVSDLEALEHAEEIADRIRRIVASGSDHFESQHRCKDGSIIDIDVSVTFLPRHGGIIYSFIRNITERKFAEKCLRLSEEKFATAFRVTPDSVTINRCSDGTYLDVNEGFTSMSGHLPEDVIGKSSIGIWVNPQDRDRLFKAIQEHGIVKNLDAEFRRKDGAVIIGQISACAIEIEGEQYLLSITRDITERENTQRELLKMQKLESLGVLAGGIAHDFNNILTGIVGNISFARMFLDPEHRSFKILLEAEKASQRATDLAYQLLTFAKGGQPIKKNVSVRQVLEASASLALRGTNVLNSITIQKDLPDIEVDEGQINQAFNNIIINAAQSMPGGGTLSIFAEHVCLDTNNAYSLPTGSFVRITFSDTGCGMSDETQKRIFDPYFTTKSGGTGLGLASVYSITKRHGGHISVRSELGKGTVFDLLLPASSQKAHAIDTSTEQLAVRDNHNKSLLIMDDEKMIRELVTQMLEELGYHVQACPSGDDAIKLYKAAFEAQNPFWAVILDLTVPGGMGGKETARHILSIDPHARLIVSSGYSNDPIMADYQKYGFSGTVAKPFKVSEIAGVLAGLQP